MSYKQLLMFILLMVDIIDGNCKSQITSMNSCAMQNSTF